MLDEEFFKICLEEIKECTKCKVEKDVNKFYFKDKLQIRRTSWCSDCMNASVKIAHNNRKSEFVEYKGGCCQICSYNKCNAALDFHHINPNEKELKFDKISSWAFERARPELDKCVLLCSNCHREVHNGVHDHIDLNKLNVSIELIKEEKQIIEYSLICKYCKCEYVSNKENQIFCSVECTQKSKEKFNISYEELKKLVWSMPTTKVAELLGVSDVAVAKRCKKLGINKPPRGYWS
jgi:hypothetical protein